MKELDARLIELIGSIDDSKITNVTHLKKERQDLLVSCESGRKHLIRFEEKHISLLHQKWGYEMMRSGGVPCPEVGAFVKPEKDIPEGCMVLPWFDAIPAAWDLTNWERWELYYGHDWVRKPVLKAYGELDMAMYRLSQPIWYPRIWIEGIGVVLEYFCFSDSGTEDEPM